MSVYNFLTGKMQINIANGSGKKWYFLGLSPKPVPPPSPLGHLGYSLSIFVEKAVFKTKNVHFGNYKIPGPPLPPYLELSYKHCQRHNGPEG